jgi:glycosyltransferase involved in cell wall biosynthesis
MKEQIDKYPLVSVIIPNYNHARYLDERIQSVLNQTYQNFEVIILDDASIDCSRKIIDKYCNNPHISNIVYNERNSGLPFKQWDKGIALAKGEIIWIAESDDSCDERFLEVLVSDMIKNNCVYVFCRLIFMDSDGYLKASSLDNVGTDTVNYWNGKEFIRHYLSFDNTVTNASGCIFRKDAALRVNHQYEKYRGSGDWLFWIEMAELGFVGFDRRSMNFYRQHGDNITSLLYHNGTNLIDDYEIFKYLNDNELIDKWKAFRRKYNQINFVLKLNFENLSIKKKVLKTWGYSPFSYFVLLPYRFYLLLKRLLGTSV